jgi:hypothetical protein
MVVGEALDVDEAVALVLQLSPAAVINGLPAKRGELPLWTRSGAAGKGAHFERALGIRAMRERRQSNGAWGAAGVRTWAAEQRG